ncbi:MAG: Rrf2 family transcriptional regulator [Butyrivibrio sp.]|nr:Rrf2 family transcriptional regulator [Butyrivibrio sp.]
MITTRGRYALQVLIDLAEHNNGSYIPLKAVAERQQISLKYLEQIMTLLNKANLVEGSAGKGGGYRLNRSPNDYIVGDILRVTERGLTPISCLEHCTHTVECKTHSMWIKYRDMTNQFFDSITIANLLNDS